MVYRAWIMELLGLDQSGVSRRNYIVFKVTEVDRRSNLHKVQVASADRPSPLHRLDVIQGGLPAIIGREHTFMPRRPKAVGT